MKKNKFTANITVNENAGTETKSTHANIMRSIKEHTEQNGIA